MLTALFSYRLFVGYQLFLFQSTVLQYDSVTFVRYLTELRNESYNVAVNLILHRRCSGDELKDILQRIVPDQTRICIIRDFLVLKHDCDVVHTLQHGSNVLKGVVAEQDFVLYPWDSVFSIRDICRYHLVG